MGLLISGLQKESEGAGPLDQVKANGSSGGASAFQDASDIDISGGTFNVVGRDNITINHFHAAQPPNDDLVAKIQDWLAPDVNFRSIQIDTFKKRTPDTGQWLLKGGDFRQWLESTGGILWGIGIPGAGKTVIASTVIDYLQKHAEGLDPGEMTLAYAYSRYTEPIAVEQILTGLAGQQLKRCPSLVRFVEPFYRQHENGETKPTQNELVDLLVKFSTVFKMSFYVLDGIDEARKDVQFDLIKVLRSIQAHFFLTSRPLENLKSQLPEATIFPVVAHDDDINLLIAEVIEYNPEFRLLLADESFKQEVIATIHKKSAGMFLHAALQLKALQDCVNEAEIRLKLDELPTGLDGMYAITIARIEQQSSNRVVLAKRILLLVIYAERLLSVQELQYALAQDLETHTFDSRRIVAEAFLLSVCCGLIYVEEDKGNDRIVRLIHFTAKDALGPINLNDFPSPHSFLASTCISRLINCHFHESDIDDDWKLLKVFDSRPFLRYAYDFWHFHARHCDLLSTTAQTIRQFLERCQSFPLTIHILRWPELLRVTGLHVASSLGLLHFLSSIPDPNTLTRRKGLTPLILALESRALSSESNGAMRLLDIPGIDVNVAEPWRQLTALMLASQKGYVNVVGRLLHFSDIEINAIDDDGVTALVHAATLGHYDVVNRLLQHGVIDVNIKSSVHGQTALIYAATAGHRDVADRLLQHERIDVNIIDRHGMTALAYAARYVHTDVVNRLLQHRSIKVDIADYEGLTPPMLAAIEGHGTIVELLLEHTPKTQLEPNQPAWVAFMQASKRGRLDLVEELLGTCDIPVNEADENGYTALILASFYGHESVVLRLLQIPDIQVNLVAENGYTALIAAADRHHITVIRHLLNAPGIKGNPIRIESGLTPLHYASELGHESVVQELLRHPPVDVNARDGLNGWTGLMYATKYGHIGVVKQLLTHPAIEINARVTSAHLSAGRTALIIASSYPRDDVVQLFLEHPKIEVNSAAKDGSTALMTAVKMCWEIIVWRLLQYPGIDVNARDNAGWTALLLASKSGRLDIVEQLLEFPGIQLDAVNEDGDSAVSIARKRYHKDVAQRILDAISKENRPNEP